MKGHRQIRNTRQRGRDRADAQVARKAALETAIPGAWCAHRRRTARPLEHALALGCETAKPGPPLHQRRPEVFFQALYRRGEGRLRHACGFRRAPEMALLARTSRSSSLSSTDGLRGDQQADSRQMRGSSSQKLIPLTSGEPPYFLQSIANGRRAVSTRLSRTRRGCSRARVGVWCGIKAAIRQQNLAPPPPWPQSPGPKPWS